MEQQTIRIRQILNTFPKAALIEMLLTQEVDAPKVEYSIQEPIEQPKQQRQQRVAPISRRRWTHIQDESLIYAVKQGRKTYAEIALMLGRTPEGIHNRLSKLRKAGLL